MTLQPPDHNAGILAALQALLDIVGPNQAPALLAQLRADLADYDSRISAAIAAGDCQALRLVTHNLIALAGTAGAARLQHLAQAVNLAAHAGDLALIRASAPPIRGGLAALAGQVETLIARRERA